jgi:vacuolar-type H+-ATPase subunit C/Vma6
MSNYDYVLAKLHAIHSRSIVGENFNRLKQITSIEKLHKELFPEDVEPATTKKLYSRIETLFKDRIYHEINDVARFFGYSNEVVNSIVLLYELDNVKIIINSHLSGLKTVTQLFHHKLSKSLDYTYLYTCDISDFRNIQKLLKGTPFKFILNFVEQRKDIYVIENELDKFYYTNILNSLKMFPEEEKGKVLRILREEMNWQNILWAFRTKIFYGKTFAEMKDSFIKSGGLISIDLIKKIYDMQFIPNECARIFKDFPQQYQDIVLKTAKEDGNIDVPLLEEKVEAKLTDLYMKFFYIGNNVLPIISFIYMKKNEYRNIIKLVESVKYNLPFNAEEAS